MSRYFLFFLYDSSVVETGLAPPACVADCNYVLKTYLLFMFPSQFFLAVFWNMIQPFYQYLYLVN